MTPPPVAVSLPDADHEAVRLQWWIASRGNSRRHADQDRFAFGRVILNNKLILWIKPPQTDGKLFGSVSLEIRRLGRNHNRHR